MIAGDQEHLRFLRPLAFWVGKFIRLPEALPVVERSRRWMDLITAHD